MLQEEVDHIMKVEIPKQVFVEDLPVEGVGFEVDLLVVVEEAP